MIQNRFFKIVGVALSFSFVVGCNSRSYESSPSSVEQKGLTLEARVNEKSKVDSKLNQIQAGAEKIKRIIEMFKRVQSPSSGMDVYTPIDFLIDVNVQLKSQIPENSDGKLVRTATVQIPAQFISEECRTVQTLLVGEDVMGDSQTKSEGVKFVYSLKTCSSNSQFIPAMEVTFIQSKFEIKFLNKNLDSMLKNLFLSEIMKDSVCKIETGEKEILSAVRCGDFKVQLTKSEDALINDMLYSNSGEVRFEANADILENSVKKASSHMQVLSDGEVKFEVNKVGQSRK